LTNFLKIGTSIEFNKHIVFVTPGFPENEQDSQCIPALQIYAKALVDSGAKVSVIALQYPFKSENYEWKGISVYPMNGENKKWKQLLLASRTVAAAKKINKERQVDVVHSFWLHRATVIGEKVAQALQAPLVATVMGQEMRAPERSFQRWKQVDYPIVSLCEFQTDALKKEGVIPTTTIPWGVTETRSTEKDLDLICVGSLIPLKNTEYFIELCAKLKEQMPDFQARIIGEGKQFDFLAHQISSKRLSSNVQLLGSLSYDETQAYIARSKALVHTSYFEGFGMITIEALASETHVMSTPVGIAKSLEVPHLIGDTQLDVAMLQMLLKSKRPEAQLFSITDTVKAYQAIYES
jgi:glycosyltransferase involved in cell wall biosynthesis